MSARDVTEEHRQHFLRALKELKHGTELDIGCVEKMLPTKFPHRDTSAVFAASAHVEELVPYQALILVVAAPNHLAKNTNLLEYKIIDGPRSGGGLQYFPASYAVFPKGRRVLQVLGLILDTDNTMTNYEVDSLVEDKAKVHIPKILEVFKNMIESFPPGNVGLELHRKAALMDLAATASVGSERAH